LSTDGLGSGGGMLSLFGSFFYILLLFAVVIGICWFLLRLTGRVKARGNMAGNLRVVESIYVGAQNMVQLVKAGDKFLVIGVSKERVSLLTELDAEQVKEIDHAMPIGASFSKVLERFMPGSDKDDGNEDTQA